MKSRLLGVSSRIDTALMAAERPLLYIVCILTLVVMFVVAGDALGRYLFNQPLGFTIDLVSKFLLPAIMYLALSETLRRGDHINVGVFASLMPWRLALFLLGIGLLASAALATAVVIEVTSKSYHTWERNIIAFGPYPWPIWLEEAIVAVSWAALCARLWLVGVTTLLASLLDIQELASPISGGEEGLLEEDV